MGTFQANLNPTPEEKAESKKRHNQAIVGMILGGILKLKEDKEEGLLLLIKEELDKAINIKAE